MSTDPFFCLLFQLYVMLEHHDTNDFFIGNIGSRKRNKKPKISTGSCTFKVRRTKPRQTLAVSQRSEQSVKLRRRRERLKPKVRFSTLCSFPYLLFSVVRTAPIPDPFQHFDLSIFHAWSPTSNVSLAPVLINICWLAKAAEIEAKKKAAASGKRI